MSEIHENHSADINLPVDDTCASPVTPPANDRVDFTAIKEAAEPHEAALMVMLDKAHGLGGHFVGHEFCARNPRRDDRNANSFKFSTERHLFSDFADDKTKGGDLIDYVVLVKGLTKLDAARWIKDATAKAIAEPEWGRMALQDYGATPGNAKDKKSYNFTPVMPIPAQMPSCDWFDPSKAHYLWPYHNEKGDIVFYIERKDRDEVDESGKVKKDFFPRFAAKYESGWVGWRASGLAGPYPLYNLHKLVASKKRTVVLVEGEKSADAAEQIFGPYGIPCVTTKGGAKSAKDSDLSPLADKEVLFWGDADTAGDGYKRDAIELLVAQGSPVKVVDADKLARVTEGGNGRSEYPKGWDAADAVEEWRDKNALLRAIMSCASPYDPATAFGGKESTQDTNATPAASPTTKPKTAARDIDVLIDQCPWMAVTADTKGADLTDPLFEIALDIAAHCVADQKRLALFSGRTGYDEAIVKAQLLQRTALTKPFPTCSIIMVQGSGQCMGCKHKTHRLKGNSPLNLPEVSAVAKANASRERAVPYDKVIKELNKQYFAVILGNKTRVGSWAETEDGGFELAPMSCADFKSFHSNKITTILTDDGEVETKKGFDWWWDDPARASYEGVSLDPNSAPRSRLTRNRLNLWSGWGREPRPGSWHLAEKHIRHVLGGDNNEYGEYLLNWFAALYQRAGEAILVALAVRGLKGCGKGTLFNMIVRSFGAHGVAVADPRHIVGNFNQHLLNKLILFIDEGFWAGDKRAEGVLKRMITDDRIMFEPKGIDAFMDVNRLSFMMATNNEWVVPVTADERRFAVFDCMDTYAAMKDGEHNPEHKPYFDALRAELIGDGLPAMMHALLQRDISNFNILNVPQTKALRAQATLSLRLNDRWWFEILNAAALPRERDHKKLEINIEPHMMTSNAVNESLKDAQTRGHHIGEDGRVQTYMRDKTGALPRRDKSGLHRCWTLPPLAHCRKEWERRFGPVDWDVPAAGWLGEDDPFNLGATATASGVAPQAAAGVFDEHGFDQDMVDLLGGRPGE